MAVPARVAIQTFHQPTNQPTRYQYYSGKRTFAAVLPGLLVWLPVGVSKPERQEVLSQTPLLPRPRQSG
jgi:hypothetical protein